MNDRHDLAALEARVAANEQTIVFLVDFNRKLLDLLQQRFESDGAIRTSIVNTLVDHMQAAAVK